MATKKDMVKDILEIADVLGLEIEANEEMSSKVLTDLLSDLRAKKRDADNDTVADDAEQKETETETETASAEGENQEVSISEEYVIASGKSITSKKGILGEGDTAKPEYFAEGAFEKLVEKKFIVKG